MRRSCPRWCRSVAFRLTWCVPFGSSKFWWGLTASGECLRLEAVELRLGDRAGVEQRLGVGDLRGRSGGARPGDLLDVVGLCCLLLGRGRHLPLRHAPAAGDQVDEGAEPGQE